MAYAQPPAPARKILPALYISGCWEGTPYGRAARDVRRARSAGCVPKASFKLSDIGDFYCLCSLKLRTLTVALIDDPTNAVENPPSQDTSTQSLYNPPIWRTIDSCNDVTYRGLL